MFGVFAEMHGELVDHMGKKEPILFSAVEVMSQGPTAEVVLDGSIAAMLQEHGEAGTALARMRELINGFQPPADACNTYRALFAGFLVLEEDLHRHIYLETPVLFPAALALAAG